MLLEGMRLDELPMGMSLDIVERKPKFGLKFLYLYNEALRYGKD